MSEQGSNHRLPFPSAPPLTDRPAPYLRYDQPAGRRGRLYASALMAILVLYLGLSLYQINLPGLHYDEAFEAVPALQLLRGQPVTAFRDSGLVLGGQLFPLMTQDYIGALNTYLAIPFIALFGATPAALRLMSILIGAVTLGLTYVLGTFLSGKRWVGVAAALILAVDPTFVFWNRQGIFVTAITAAIGLAAALCWLHRLRGDSARWSLAGAFLCGLGLYAKFLFLWLIAAMIGTVLLLHLPGLLRERTRLVDFLRHRKAEIGGSIIAFLIGCWPLIAYNLQTGGTFLSLAGNSATSYYGVNNLALGSNLTERLGQFIIFLNGSHLWYLGRVFSNIIPASIFSLVLILVILGAGFSSFLPSKNVLTSPSTSPGIAAFGSATQVALFPFLIIGLVILSSIGTVSALWITHFAILMPWPAIAVAGGSWFVLDRAQALRPEKRSWLKAGLWAGLAVMVAAHLVSTVRYHQALTESGGLSSHSDAIYDLADWLAAHAPGAVVSMDWGLAAPVSYLTGGQVKAIEVFGYAWDPDTELTNRLEQFIKQPDTLYLWRAPDEIIFDRSAQFKALYRPLNFEENIEAAFYERSGRPILGVTRLVAQGTAENPPQ